MDQPSLIALAALAGGLVAIAVREALLSAPRIASWLRAAVTPLSRVAREGYVLSASEQRRLGLLGSGAIATLALLLTGLGPLTIAAAAGPWCVSVLVGQRRERYRRAVERSVPDVAGAIADAISGGHSVRGAVAAAAANRDRVEDEARAATTQARFTGLLVVALPAGAALFAELLQPGFISRVLAEPASAAMLMAAGALQMVGFALIRRLGTPSE